ncbi:MAG: hypothetical protein ISS28_02125 [Candidatus Cloacimonetes bacterium]|nr:hypothetical protein [Candidatus Cloacimonadota bacterium]MBL7085886.1 hypothetical protein [Candidatus Cloacimonadota bacterium]
MNKYDLEERLIEFSVLIIEIVNLPCEINRRFSFAISQGECPIQKQEIIYPDNWFVQAHQSH